MKKLFSVVLFAALVLVFSACEKQLSEKEVQAMIDKALSEQEEGVSQEEMQDAVDDAIAEYEHFRNHKFVDLGLSVLWATCNIGATKPEEYGSYFAWGETAPKDIYNWSSYTHGAYDTNDAVNEGFTKYNKTDKRATLDPQDDAAHVNWGGAWRMPTFDEQQELLDNCTWTWTTKNGIEGYEVKSKTNDNSIFLPAAGYRNESSLTSNESNYWSSSLYAAYPGSSRCMRFFSKAHYWASSNRDSGYSVRAVCSARKK